MNNDNGATPFFDKLITDMFNHVTTDLSTTPTPNEDAQFIRYAFSVVGIVLLFFVGIAIIF